MPKTIRDAKKLTTPIYKVPHCVQDTIPIYRIAKDGIFELECKNGNHQFDKVYLFEDINYSVQDEEGQERLDEKFKKMLNSMAVSYKIEISNHYTTDKKLYQTILNRASSETTEPLANEYKRLINERFSAERLGLEQTRYFVITCEKSDYKSAKMYFDTIEYNLMSQFKSLGSKLIPLNATERLRALHGFYRFGEEETFSFDWNNYLNLRRDWRNDIINISLRERKDYLEMEKGKVASALFVRSFASGLNDRFLRDLGNMPFPITITVDNEPLDSDFSYQMVMKKYMSNDRSIIKQQQQKNDKGDFSTDVSYEKRKQQEELEELLDGIRSYDEKLFLVGVTIVILANDLKDLESRKEKVITTAKGYNMEIDTYSENQLAAFQTTLPVGCRFISNMRSITTDSLSALNPFNVQEISDNNGFYYGVNQITKNMIIGNRKLQKNANGFVFGLSGAGKSFNTKMEMGQVLAFTNDDIIVVDPMAEYKGITQKWNGQYINLSKSGKNITYINPFHVPNSVDDKDKFIAEKAEFAYAICEQALKPDLITSKHIAIIDKAVRVMYEGYFKSEKKKNIPTLPDMRQLILEDGSDVAEELAAQLEVFTNGTLDIFSQQETIPPKNRFLVFGFSDIGKRMRGMAMLIMLETITSRIKYNQENNRATWVYVDEIHELWDDEYSLLAIQRMWREVRKRGGVCTGMTQNIIDGMNSRQVQTMISNSEFTMLLDQGVMDRPTLSNIFDVSQEQVSFVNGADKGCGLLRFGSKIVPFDNTVSPDDPFFKLFNTDFHTIEDF